MVHLQAFVHSGDYHGISYSVGLSPVFDLLQTEIRTSIMASTPALTKSAGMVLTRVDSSSFSALTGASICSCMLERGSSSGICAQSSSFEPLGS